MAESEILWIMGAEFPAHPYHTEITTKAVSEPYPSALWKTNDNKTYHEILRKIPEKPMIKPYPKALWRIENGSLKHKLLPITGGFSNTINFGKIHINSSIKLSLLQKCRINFLYRI